MTTLVLLALLAQVEAPKAAPKTAAPHVQAEAALAPEPVKQVDVAKDTPPPSAWDKAQYDETGLALPEGEEGVSFAGGMIKSLLSLLLVVALIYALGKLAQAKMGRLKGTTTGNLVISERLQVDAKNALFVVTVDGKQRLLVGGGGDKGLALLATLDPVAPSVAGDAFQQALNKTASPLSTHSETEDKEGST